MSMAIGTLVGVTVGVVYDDNLLGIGVGIAGGVIVGALLARMDP